MQNEEKSQQNRESGLLSIGEASEYLGVSIDTLRRWQKRGKLVAFRSPGGHRYFQKEKLDGLFNQKYVREPKQSVSKPTSLKEELTTEERIETQAPGEKTEPPSVESTETILIPKSSSPVLGSYPEKLQPASETETLKEEPKPETKTKEELLKSILSTSHTEKKKISGVQIAAIFGLVVFAILDIILLYVWFATPKLLSPIP